MNPTDFLRWTAASGSVLFGQDMVSLAGRHKHPTTSLRLEKLSLSQSRPHPNLDTRHQ